MLNPLISLCHATARLPVGWVNAFWNWVERCDDRQNVEYILAADHDGGPGNTSRLTIDLNLHCQQFRRFVFVQNRGEHSSTAAWNRAAAEASGKLLISIADDYFPPEHWDTQLRDCVLDWEAEYVLDVDNQDNAGGLMAFAFMSRHYYERKGYMWYPEYKGVQVDTDFTHVAHRDGVVINAKHLKFKHENPGVDPANWDAVYTWQRRPEACALGDQILARRLKENFA